jgi:hypothetical protein
MRGVVVFLVVAAAAGGAWRMRAASLARQREAFYQATLRSYSDALKPGSTRKEVESYFRAHNTAFRQTCGMYDWRNAFADLVKIGEESHPWYGSEHNVYVGFEFVSAGTHEMPRSEDSDTVTSVTLYHWFEGCL